MNIIWQSVKYDPSNVVAVYASRCYSDGNVKVFEVDNKSKTLRETFHRIENFPLNEQTEILANQTVHKVKITAVPK